MLREATRASQPTDWDSVGLAASTGHYDMTHGVPQPPGYFLYSMAGRLIQVALHAGPVSSLVTVSALLSAGAVAFSYVAGREIGGPWLAWPVAGFLVTSPFMWFTGSMVATYSVDALMSSLLVLLAWRARPGSIHGVLAAAALGLGAGFRQSVAWLFLPIALVAVARSVRSWRRLWQAAVAGAAGFGVWALPLALVQPGGLKAWLSASHVEAVGSLRQSSVLDHGPLASTVAGQTASFGLAALGPLMLLAAVALVIAAASPRSRLAVVGRGGRHSVGGAAPVSQDSSPAFLLLSVAIAPALASDLLIEFGKAGYVLAFVPAAALLLMLLPARIAATGSRGAVVVLTCLMVAVIALGAQRFLLAPGVLPLRYVGTGSGIWLTEPRYGAPYGVTRAELRRRDAFNVAMQRLDHLVDCRRDSVLMDTTSAPNTAEDFRLVGWAVPTCVVTMGDAGAIIYRQHTGLLYYTPRSPPTLPVRAGGRAIVLASVADRSLVALQRSGLAHVTGNLAGYRVWAVAEPPPDRPAAVVDGIGIDFGARRIPLGAGILATA